MKKMGKMEKTGNKTGKSRKNIKKTKFSKLQHVEL